jgi:2-polyprenyl-3-methyl-5-hydroxy-6-metoxy-1,4-benzoquinol methylase
MTGPTWQLEEVACDYCGSTEADILLRGRDRVHGLPGEFNIVVCRQCGLARTNPRPTVDSLGAAYPETYAPHRASQVAADPPRGMLRWALVNRRGYPIGRRSSGTVRALLAPAGAVVLARRRALGYPPYQGEGRLLDFGCGVGGYVAKMAAAGWKAEGIDASPQAVRLGREAGLTIHEGTLPGVDLAPGSFDVITMWQALEHVPSPKATLRAARDLLKPDGRLMVVVPRLDSREARWFGPRWFALELPRHLTHFTRETLRRHLEAAGFEVEWVYGIRRPAVIRRSFAHLADETGRWVHRRLAHSRVVAGLLGWLALAAGGSGQMMCVARRRG